VTFSSVAFVGGSNGWIVGAHGAILHTSVPAPAMPLITTLKPSFGKRYATVTISGRGFGAARGTSTVKFGTKVCANYVSWTAARIKVKVPAKAAFGKLKLIVTTKAGTSNATSFTVKR